MGEIKVFILQDRKPIIDSKFEDDTSKKLDFAFWHGIKNPCFYVEPGGGRKHIRYIKGAKTIFVEDQNKNGEIFNPISDVLGFDSGNDLLVDIDSDQLAIDFLMAHPNNAKSENHRPGINEPVFTLFVAEEKREIDVKAILLEDEAVNVLRGLLTEEKRLKSVAAIFEVPTTLSSNEMYLRLREKAVANPALFISSVADKKNSFFAEIKKGLELGIIQRSEDGFKFTNEGGLILQVPKKKSVNDAEQMLLEFLMKEEAQPFYDQLRLKVEEAENNSSKPL